MTAFDFEVHDENIRLRVRPFGSPRIDSEPGEIQLVSHDLFVEATRTAEGKSNPESAIVTVGISPLFQIGGNREGVLDISPDRAAGSFAGNPSNGNGAECDPSVERTDAATDCPKSPWVGSERAPEIGFTGLIPFEAGLTDRFTRVEIGTGGSFDYDRRSNRYVPVDPGTGPYRKGYFHETAGLAVLDDVLFDANGHVLPPFPGLISTRKIRLPGTGRRVTVTQIDLEVLGRSGLWPANGLLFAGRSDTLPQVPDGVLLTNGRELADPLTVVSDSPVYLRGDYNVIRRKGAAVIGDRIHVLSETWNGDGAEGSGSPEAAAPCRARSTTIVASLVSGRPATAAPGRECGFWDLVQLHEDWHGCRLVVRGSCASIYPSRTAAAPASGARSDGKERGGRPELRHEFDRENLHVDRLPPFTPLAMWVRHWAPQGAGRAPAS